MRQRRKNTVSSSTELQTRRYYTPQLNAQAVFFLRRLAWRQGKPMTQTLNALVLAAASQLPAVTVCQHCGGSKEQCCACPAKTK